jgi:hypothetical protein
MQKSNIGHLNNIFIYKTLSHLGHIRPLKGQKVHRHTQEKAVHIRLKILTNLKGVYCSK